MALDPAVLLGSLAAILGLGYLGSLLFDRTHVPDILLLIGLGVLLGPVLRVLDPAVFTAIAPTVGVFALLIILFDGGLSLKLRELVSGLPRATVLAVVGWVLTVAAVALVLAVAHGWDLRLAMVLGAVVGGSSSIAVIPLAQRLKLGDDARVALSLESALTDVLCVVGVLALVGTASRTGAFGAADVRTFLEAVLGDFSVALVLGAIAGAAWAVLWSRLERGNYAYMVTLAAVLLLYLGVEAAGGAGPIAVLAFGVLLGNRRLVLRKWVSGTWELGGEMRRFHGEVAFFIRAFFFVGLGILVDPGLFRDTGFLAVSGAIVGALLVARALTVLLATAGSKKLKGSRGAMFVLLPRGLAAAVLASVPAAAGVPGSEAFVGYAFAAIVATNVFTTAGMVALRPRRAGPRPSRAPTGEAAQAEAQAAVAEVAGAAAAGGAGGGGPREGREP